MNALNMIIMNMDMDISENAAAPAQANTEGNGIFKSIMNAQGNSGEQAQETEDTSQSSNIMDILRFHLLVKDSEGNMVNLKAELTEDGSAEETQDSKCSDLDLQGLVDGIVGIIEGFGLLDYNTDESTLEQLSSDIAAVVNEVIGNLAATQGSNTEEADLNLQNMGTLSDEIARMLTQDQSGEVATDVMTLVEDLVEKYQCSFDNTNSTGVGKSDSQQNGEVGADKIMLMMKNAMGKAQAAKQSNQTDQETSQNESGLNGNGQVLNFGKAAEGTQTMETVGEMGQNENAQAAMDENVANLADKITAAQLEDKQEFDITLKPDYLGKLSVKLIMDGDGIKAQIKAGDQYVKGLITDQLPELSEQLRSKGVNMTNIEVVYDSPNFAGFEGQFHGNGSNMAGNASKGFSSGLAAEGTEAAEDNMNYNAAMDYTDLSMGLSSVEFTA